MIKSGYQLLDKQYFNVVDVPPPLVLKSWMLKVQEELDEDKNHTITPPIVRKRGRPKKVALPIKAIDKKSVSHGENCAILEEDGLEHFEVCASDHDSDIGGPVETSYETTQHEENSNREIEKGKKIFVCDLCPKEFKAKSTLNYHYRIHSGNLNYCKVCNRGFVTKYLLKCHSRLHNGELYSCDMCDRGFTTAELLKIHRRRHLGDKPFACDQCPRRFPASSNLLQHKEIHSESTAFLCPECGASFTVRRCLDRHMAIHSPKKYTCQECGKQWVRKSDLNEHMRVHTKDKPYNCKVCLKQFSQSSTLRRHWQTHNNPTSLYPHQCPHCHMKFRTPGTAYQVHVATHSESTANITETEKEDQGKKIR